MFDDHIVTSCRALRMHREEREREERPSRVLVLCKKELLLENGSTLPHNEILKERMLIKITLTISLQKSNLFRARGLENQLFPCTVTEITSP